MMRSFLGVPIVSRAGVIGAFYLTEKEGARDFEDDDQQLIELLAAHAAIAIENARLLRAQPRALDRRGAEPARPRPARRGRRSGCSASRWPPSRRRRCSSATPTGRARSSAAGSSRRRRWTSCARSSSSCGRRSRGGGPRHPLRKHVDVLRRVAGRRIGSSIRDVARCAPTSTGGFRIAQEALQRAPPRRRRARRRAARGRRSGGPEVADDGSASTRRTRRLRAAGSGLTSMEERAPLGGALSSTPAGGRTRSAEVADG